MIVDNLQDTLNGGYNGLYGEVVTHDCYRLKQINFIPNIIFDLGANVGVFTRFAHSMFPNALIIAVEPDEENYAHLVKFTNGKNIIFINKAIGLNGVSRRVGSINGAHESYVSDGIGMDEVIQSGEKVERVGIETVMPDELIKTHLQLGMKSILKLDIELNESVIWDHKPSMDAIKDIDYFTGEVHWSMLTGNARIQSKQRTFEALNRFNDTHHMEINHTNFWATKK